MRGLVPPDSAPSPQPSPPKTGEREHEWLRLCRVRCFVVQVLSEVLVVAARPAQGLCGEILRLAVLPFLSVSTSSGNSPERSTELVLPRADGQDRLVTFHAKSFKPAAFSSGRPLSVMPFSCATGR